MGVDVAGSDQLGPRFDTVVDSENLDQLVQEAHSGSVSTSAAEVGLSAERSHPQTTD